MVFKRTKSTSLAILDLYNQLIKVPLHLFFDFTSFDRSKCADFENEKIFAIRGVFVELGAVLCPIVVLHEQSGNERISDVIVVRRMPTTIT